MPNPIKPRRSWTANAVPQASDFLSTNELLINWADGIVYGKNPTTNAVVSWALGGGGGGSAEDPRWAYLLPAAPTNVAASPGNAQATVTWTAPASVAAITDYVVQYSSNSGSSWTTFSEGTSTATSATVTGLTNGTSYVFRVAAVSGIGQGAYSTASSAVSPGGDPLYSKVALLLHMDGSGSTFVDSSKYARAITANGNATQSSSQSKWGGKSLALDGNGDYIKTASSSSLAFGTGDFCVEFWINPSAASSQNYGRLIQCGNFPSAGGWQLVRGTSAGGGSSNPVSLLLDFTDGTSSVFRLEGGTLADGQWSHVALSRSGSTVSMYVNGTRVATGASSQNLTQNTIVIGDSDGGGSAIAGYIDDVRITVGASRDYTGATIAVPTEAFPEATPGTDPWISDVALLLHMDGANGSTSFTDSSPSPRTISAFGNAQISTTQSKFGGASCRLAATGDYLTFTGGQSIGTGDFCVEFFAYSAWSGAQMLFDFRSHAQLAMWTDGTSLLMFNSGSFATRATLTPNTWQHIALTRQGSSLRLFVDGSLSYTTTDSSNFPHASGTNWIGKPYDANWSVPNLWLDEFRITAGSARYTANFTPPTAAFPDA